MKKCQYTFLLLIVICITGCKGNRQEDSLNEKEYYFDEKLSAISEDGDSAVWIGSEYGDLWHISSKRKIKYQTGSDRIYEVLAGKETDGLRDCWIGARNAGVQKWILANGKLTKSKDFTIPHKGSRYSAYDIIEYGNKLYFATSQGLYTMNKNSSGQQQMRLLYPDKKKDNWKEGTTFIIKKLCNTGDFIIAATQNGLLRINTKTGEQKISHPGKKIKSVAMFDGKIMALGESHFYTESINGEYEKDVNLDFHATIFYKANGIYCFFDANRAFVTQDLKDFTEITLRRSVPAFCSNAYVSDRKNCFVSLITDNALWRIPIHLNISSFNTNVPVTAACFNGKDSYYVNSHNEVFIQKGNSMKAFKIFDFIKESPITDIFTIGNTLYYLNDNQEIKKISLGNSLLYNYMRSQITDIYCSKAKITSFGINKNSDSTSLYIGIQDGLVRIPQVKDYNRIDTILQMNNKYVTSYFTQNKSDMTYMATLNNGIYYGKNGKFTNIEGTETLKNIRSIMVTKDCPPMIMALSGNRLVLSGSRDTLDAKGIEKLIPLNDSTIYALPEYGVKIYHIKNRHIIETPSYFNDIKFCPQASFAKDNCIYLGCNFGVLCLTANNMVHTQWLTMESSDITRGRILFIVIAIIFIILTTIIILRQYHHVSRRHLMTTIKYLQHRLENLDVSSQLLKKDYCLKIKQLYTELDSIQIGNGKPYESADKKITEILDSITYMNSNMILLLMKYIDKQISDMKNVELYDCQELIKNTNKALDTGNIDNIRTQALQNRDWLKNITDTQKLLNKYSTDIEGTLPLTDINDQLDNMIRTYKEGLTSKSLKDMDGKLQLITQKYELIFSSTAIATIAKYAEKRRKDLKDINNPDYVVSALLNQFESCIANIDVQDRITLLRNLNHCDIRIKQMLLKISLAKLMDEYDTEKQIIIRTNEKKINKLFDRNLEQEISYRTKDITKEIEKTIEQLYFYMNITDHRILTDIFCFTNYDNQQPKVLALLIADSKVKRTSIPGMLEVIGNLNPVISRMVKNKIKPNEAFLKEYTSKHPASLVNYILALV